MRYERVVGIQPAILRWARESLGLHISDVAGKLKRSLDEIISWEDGSAAPTYPQLEKLAYQVYKRPLAVFFLPKPPDEIPPDREFRTLPDTDLESLEPDTYLQIRKAHAFKLALNDLFNGVNPGDRHIWSDVSLFQNRSVKSQAHVIREYLGIGLDMQTSWKDDDTALKAWRQVIENAGVFVFKASFRQKEISGFCLADNTFPIVYLNNSTTKTRQIFSLLHELAHLLLGMNGLGKLNQNYIDLLPQKEKGIERFCNAIAAEVLIPSDDFARQTELLPFNVERLDDTDFGMLASRYGVSRESILRRFLDQGRASQSFYEIKARFWASQKKSTSGGDWYASQNVYLSARFAQEIVSRHYRHEFSLEQASDLLGIKAKNFEKLEQRILSGAL